MTPIPTTITTPTLSTKSLLTVASDVNSVADETEVLVASNSKCTAADKSWSVETTTIKRWKVLSYNQLPLWLRDNDYLLEGHRPQLNFRDCAFSVFRMHSETGNIWTHLLGVLFFIGLAIELYTFSGWDMLLMDKLIFGVYFFAALGCLSFSTIYHTFSCHSESVASTCQAFDYVGIAIMITGSLMSYLYYAFFCSKTAQIVYLSVFPVAGFSVAVVTLWPKMGQPEFPYIHYYFLLDEALPVSNLKTFGMAIFYIGGACIYANRIPEKIKPGYCDYWFQSHQIFHICVVIAAFIHYLNIHEMAAYRGYGKVECPHAAGSVPTITSPNLII